MALGYRHGCWEQHLLVCGPSVKVEQRVASGSFFFFLIGNDLSTKSNQSILRIKRKFVSHFCHSKAASSRPLRMHFEGSNLLPCFWHPVRPEGFQPPRLGSWTMDVQGRRFLVKVFFWVQDWWWIYDGILMDFGWVLDGFWMGFWWIFVETLVESLSDGNLFLLLLTMTPVEWNWNYQSKSAIVKGSVFFSEKLQLGVSLVGKAFGLLAAGHPGFYTCFSADDTYTIDMYATAKQVYI